MNSNIYIVDTVNDTIKLFKTYLDRTNMEHKKYQYDGVNWIVNNELRKKHQQNHSNDREDDLLSIKGGFIADEMGLGKTIMMIGVMVCNFLPKTLIVVPPVLLGQWFSQIYKTTGHKPIVYHGKNKKQISYESLNKAIIIITTYGEVALRQKQKNNKSVSSILHSISWNRIIFDESHHLRNSATTIYKGVKLLISKIKWFVSGTPIQNSKKDFYSLCSLLGIPTSFYTDTYNLPTLAKLFILKRTKQSVGIKMTNMIIDKNIVEWKNNTEMKLCKEIHSSLPFSNIPVSLSSSLLNKNVLKEKKIISLMLLARQICIYPKLIKSIMNNKEKEKNDYSSKLDFVVNTILERKGNDCGKLILFNIVK